MEYTYIENFGPKVEAEELTYTLNATQSPFTVLEGEKIVRSCMTSSNVGKIMFEISNGYLTETHRQIAAAVGTLRYTTTWQVQRFLSLTKQQNISSKRLRQMISRLVKLEILSEFHFQAGFRYSVRPVVMPGRLYQSFTNLYSGFYPSSYISDEVLQPKTQLAANQLLLGMLYGRNGKLLDNRPLIVDQNTRVRPHHIVREGDTTFYLEGLRKNKEERESTTYEKKIQKLLRYQSYFRAQKDTSSTVIVVLENKEEMAAFKKLAEETSGLDELHVELTCDLQALPVPVTEPVKFKKAGFFKKVGRFIDECFLF